MKPNRLARVDLVKSGLTSAFLAHDQILSMYPKQFLNVVSYRAHKYAQALELGLLFCLFRWFYSRCYGEGREACRYFRTL